MCFKLYIALQVIIKFFDARKASNSFQRQCRDLFHLTTTPSTLFTPHYVLSYKLIEKQIKREIAIFCLKKFRFFVHMKQLVFREKVAIKKNTEKVSHISKQKTDKH